MKTYLSLVAAVAVVAAGTFLSAHPNMEKDKNLKPDGNGHLLTALWKNYEEARRADRPQKMADALEAIKREARAKRLHWDFYDAVVKYKQDASGRNWKLRDSLQENLSKEINDYAEPVVSYFHAMGTDQRNLVLSSKVRLQAGRNFPFYKNSSVHGELNGLLPDFIRDDYEFALWNEYVRNSGSNAWASAALADYLGERYPNARYLEYIGIRNKAYPGNPEAAAQARKEALMLFAGKNSARAISLLAKEDLLWSRMYDLNGKGGSQDFRSLFAACQDFEKIRAAYSGDPDVRIAMTCLRVWALMRELESKDIRLSCTEDSAVLSLRNVDKVELVLRRTRDDKVFLKRTVENPVRSFYVRDEIRVVLPKVDDGDYKLTATNGKLKGECSYEPHTLSIALQDDHDGQKFYVAGFRTGKPADKVDLELRRSGRRVTVVKDVPVDGFTPLPPSLVSALKAESMNELVAGSRGSDGLLRETKVHEIWNPHPHRDDGEQPARRYCRIFTDRTAFNPGETVKFKALLYQDDMGRALHTLGPGEKVTVELLDAESKRIASESLTTNEHGSVAGEFLLPMKERNGRFQLEVRMENERLSSLSLIVDEFILPTYDLQFEDLDSLYFQGDTVPVRGKISSYSGHPLSAARVTYTVNAGRDRIGQGTVALEADGSFTVLFPADQNHCRYDVRVKVADETGETREFSRRVFILDHANLHLSLLNMSEGSLCPAPADRTGNACILSGERATLMFEAHNNEGNIVPADISYLIQDVSGRELYKGTVPSGTQQDFPLKVSGKYSVTAEIRLVSGAGAEITDKETMTILRLSDSDRVLVSEIENVFKVLGPAGPVKNGDEFGIQLGAGCGEVWAVAELFNDRQKLLDMQKIYLTGVPGTEGSLARITYSYKEEWPDAVLLKVFYFKNETSYQYSREFRRKRSTLELPLAFETFEDRTLPATEYSFILKTLPNVEAVAAVFDKSTETLSPNRWNGVSLSSVRCDGVRISATPGSVSSREWGTEWVTGWGRPVAFGLRSAKAMATRSVKEEDLVQETMAMNVAPELNRETEDAAALEEVALRSDFSASLAFEPFLRSEPDGTMKLKFKTSDKLSTYYVQLFAHDPAMRNATFRKEMVVTIPVKVAVSEPKYLYRGDAYVLHATVSNSSETPVSGTAGLVVLGADDRVLHTFSKPVIVPAGGALPVTFPVPVEADSLRCKVVFTDAAKTFSDGILIALPVRQACQILTETHSAVFRAGMDKAALKREIASRFTGTTAVGATTEEIDIRQMLRDAVPSKISPSGEDALSLSEAVYARYLAAQLQPDAADGLAEGTTELLSKILACQNADGGFGWFEGMRSSAVITAILLERAAKMESSLLSPDRITSAVRYLDREQFLYDDSWPFWYGNLSLAQYAHVRTMFASVPFDVERVNRDEKSAYSENFKDFKQWLKDYLLPKAKDGRGLNGRILGKSRRIKTLLQLLNNPGGLDLASAWGIRFAADSRMIFSAKADLQSLLEYAVAHRDGGWYYPNAVLPWRGLLESELYAHSLLCDLFSDPKTLAVLSRGDEESEACKVADGIRIWIMLQKETQQWDTAPTCLEAVHSVMRGSEEVLSTSVIFMRKSYEKPFTEILAAGNGFTIERRFYREVKGAPEINRLEVRPGDLLHVGDKLTAEYRIWNQENRSFVKLTAPREAGFRPVEQLSGHYGWWLHPLPVRGTCSVVPQGYRNVKTNRTEYYFDVYPEEKTTVTETFFVTQEGTFSAPVVTIESLYAPHYRANDRFGGAFTFH